MLLAAVLFCGCETNEDLQPVELEINLMLSASEISASNRAPERRAFGDPGTTETFRLPQHAYIFLVWNDGSETHVDLIEADVSNPASWTRTNNRLVYNVPGDSVFLYNKKVVKMLSGNRTWGRLYVAMSYSDIAPYSKLNPSRAVADYTEDDVKNLVFNVTAELQDELQDIYSTPLHYEPDGSTYYGTIANFAYSSGGGGESGARVAYANILLYHVAAKVDLIWNVAEEARSSVKLSYLQAYNLYKDSCYLFKPTDNVVTGPTYDKAGGEGGYAVPIISGAVPGTQWQSRAYYYAIPYKNKEGKYPMQYCMRKNGDPATDDNPATPDDYKLVIKKTLDAETDGIWTSWIRGQINITNLEYKATADTISR